MIPVQMVREWLSLAVAAICGEFAHQVEIGNGRGKTTR
jgi:hypothetical protein